MIAFTPGKTYELRFIGDADLKVPVTVLKRTKKFITVKLRNETKRTGIKIYNGVEYALPEGSYSMAPSIRASKEFIHENA